MCRSGCPTQDHATFGECARAANIQVGPADARVRKVFDRGLESYRDARRQGVQPLKPDARASQQALDAAEAA